MSPIQRRQERVVDEMKRFSREQYKMNFVELQVPSGHQNPLRYKPKIYETSMTQEQAHLLHNISREQTREQQPCDILRQNEIDCGLISILLAICYDVRTTNNEATCESGWTRSILCPLYCYFEQFDNYRDVLVAFLRRMITYPMYRNFELGQGTAIYSSTRTIFTFTQTSSCTSESLRPIWHTHTGEIPAISLRISISFLVQIPQPPHFRPAGAEDAADKVQHDGESLPDLPALSAPYSGRPGRIGG